MNKTLTKPELINILFDSMNKRNFSLFEKVIINDIIFDFPGAGRMEGNKKVLVFLKILLRKYPELIFSISDIIVENNKACAVWTNRGKSNKEESYSNSGITLFYFSGNKISFISDYFKDTSFTQNS